MSRKTPPRASWLLIPLLLAGAASFSAGITWGLPSRAADPFLFGDQAPWTGGQIAELAGGWGDEPERGSDVDINPLRRGAAPMILNQTDVQRAEIVRRYRLYTYQPDEMITLRALASMRPGEGRLDPRLYQYGGLWIYPVGVLLKLASIVGLISLQADVAWYLDRPEEFARFYVVARLYSAAWGLAGLAAVVWTARRLCGGAVLPAVISGLCYAAMPVVINMAHEAKPHLPGAVLQVMAIAAAMKYVETGRWKWWWITAGACGAAFGMVLSAWPVFIVLPVMTFLRPGSWTQRFMLAIGAGLVGTAVYLITNPYIVINLFINREVLHSNFGNSLAMYEVGRWREGLVNAAGLITEGASWAAAVFGCAAGLVCLAWAVHASGMRTPVPPAADQPETPAMPRKPNSLAADTLLLAAPAVLIIAQFVALAAGKPGEYGRFAVLPDVILGIAGVALLWRAPFPKLARSISLLVLFALVAVEGQRYLTAFIRDSRSPSRLTLARAMETLNHGGARTLAVSAEPAPYLMPPVDLFKWQIRLMPAEDVLVPGPGLPDVIVHPADSPLHLQAFETEYLPLLVPHAQWTRISWADKLLFVGVRRSLFPPVSQPAASR